MRFPSGYILVPRVGEPLVRYLDDFHRFLTPHYVLLYMSNTSVYRIGIEASDSGQLDRIPWSDATGFIGRMSPDYLAG